MNIEHIKKLNLEEFASGEVHRRWFDIITDPFGMELSVPIFIAKGKTSGTVMGLTAVVHGNELNGISVIQRLFRDIDVKNLKGAIIAVPVVNVPSFMQRKRRFLDGADLNHIMPGKQDGNISEVYAYRFVTRIVSNFNYLFDLHTASFGRINSYYIRADMDDQVTAELAKLQNAQIIVHNPPSDGTLRGYAEELGIPSITLEVGNPNTFQKGFIRSGLTGIHNALIYLEMLDGEIEYPQHDPILCKDSFWLYTKMGGLLTVYPQIVEEVKIGDLIASQNNIFGDRIMDYHAPDNGVIIGKSVNPVNQSGGRILHLGVMEEL